MEVTVVEKPEFLASPYLRNYDVILLNYQNHKVPPPEGALANLKSAIEGGKGLVLFHFACGAFIDWDTKTVPKEFLAIAGRVWNPKLRAHDPRGSFTVNITDKQHPITKGLSDFEAEDELYTCLDGDVPIHVLAKATSKVDGKEHPMAFVLTPGKGRTFHCVLGHDVKALNPNTLELFRCGTAWAAGLQ
jgi:type 1 glutamine amidotransferase